MALQSNTERASIRLAPYIGELQEFFTSRSLRFGSPEDIAPIASLLSVPGSFQDEMASMVRSIIYREQGIVPHTELLELVTVAIGGPRVDDSAQEVHESVRRILTFIGGVLRSRKSSFAAERSTATAVETPGTAFSARDPDTGWGAPSPDIQPEPSPIPVSLSRLVTASRTTSDVYLRASHILSNPEESHEAGGGVSFAAADEAQSEESPFVVPPQPPKAPALLQTFSWICGIGLMLFFLFMNKYLDDRTPRQRQSQTSSADTASDIAATDKSSLVSLVIPPHRNTQAGATTPLAPIAVFHSAGAPAGEPLRTQAKSDAGVARPLSLQTSSETLSASTAPPGAYVDRAPYSQPVMTEAARTVSLGATSSGRAARFDRHTRQGSFAVSSGVMAGNLVSAPVPEYPKLASFTRVQGQVILQAVVSRNGRVVDTHVIRGPHLLRGAATKAVRRWRYRPYVLNGKATDVATIVTVDFQLHQ